MFTWQQLSEMWNLDDAQTLMRLHQTQVGRTFTYVEVLSFRPIVRIVPSVYANVSVALIPKDVACATVMWDGKKYSCMTRGVTSEGILSFSVTSHRTLKSAMRKAHSTVNAHAPKPVAGWTKKLIDRPLKSVYPTFSDYMEAWDDDYQELLKELDGDLFDSGLLDELMNEVYGDLLDSGLEDFTDDDTEYVSLFELFRD
jgi:hypothetical protein